MLGWIFREKPLSSPQVREAAERPVELREGMRHRHARRVIHIHAAAPAKPALTAPCNGCGICCATDPCPVGMVVSRRIHGACEALVWNDDASMYRCGLLGAGTVARTLVRRWAAQLLRRLAQRYIAAGVGCDCTLEVEPAPPSAGSNVTPR